MIILPLTALPFAFEAKLPSDRQRGAFGRGLAGGDNFHAPRNASSQTLKQSGNSYFRSIVWTDEHLASSSALHSKTLGERKTPVFREFGNTMIN